MEPEISPESPEDNVEATANAFAIAFLSLPSQVKSRFFEIIKERKGEKRDGAERLKRLEAFKERQRQEQQQRTLQKTSEARIKQESINQPSKQGRNKKAVSSKSSKKKRQNIHTPGITAAEAILIKFRNLNAQELNAEQASGDKNKESSKPYKAQSKLISSGARLCELCGKHHQGNTCY